MKKPTHKPKFKVGEIIKSTMFDIEYYRQVKSIEWRQINSDIGWWYDIGFLSFEDNCKKVNYK